VHGGDEIGKMRATGAQEIEFILLCTLVELEAVLEEHGRILLHDNQLAASVFHERDAHF